MESFTVVAELHFEQGVNQQLLQYCCSVLRHCEFIWFCLKWMKPYLGVSCKFHFLKEQLFSSFGCWFLFRRLLSIPMDVSVFTLSRACIEYKLILWSLQQIRLGEPRALKFVPRKLSCEFWTYHTIFIVNVIGCTAGKLPCFRLKMSYLVLFFISRATFSLSSAYFRVLPCAFP